jgi:invasion protein IalB
MSVLSKSLVKALCVCLLFSSAAYADVKAGDRFDDWVYECDAESFKEEVCALTHTLMDEEGKNRIIKLTLGRLGKQGELALVALVPLGIYLPGGIIGTVDTGQPFSFTLRTCTELGCEGVVMVDQKLRWKLKAGKTLAIKFMARPRSEAIMLPVSLNGLSAGLEVLDKE